MQNLKIVVAFFIIYSLQAQTTVPDKKPKVSVLGHSYPMFLNGEQHSYIGLNYYNGINFKAELSAFYDTYPISDRLRTSIIFKRYFYKKLYVLGGLNMELELPKYWNNSFGAARFGVLGGVGYDVNSNFNVEMRSDFSLNKSAIGVFGEPFIEMPKVYTFKGKLKF